MNQTAEREIDLRHYTRILWRRKWYAVIPPVVLAVTAALAIPLIKPTYQVRSVILFEGRQRMARQVERFLLPSQGQQNGQFNSAARIFEMKIRGSGFLEGVVRTLGLDDDPQMRARADEILARSAPGKKIDDVILERKVAMLRNMIAVNTVDEGVYSISTFGPSQEFVYALAVAVNEHLLSTVRQELLSEIRAASDFSTEQMEIYREKLEESQRALSDYEAKLMSRSYQPLSTPTIDRRAISDLLNQTNLEIDRASREAAPLRQDASAALGTALPVPIVRETESVLLLGQRLDSFERELAWLLIEHQWSDPAVVSQNERILETRKSLQAAIELAVQAEYPGLDRDVQRSLAETAFLERIQKSLEVRKTSLRERNAPVSVIAPGPSVDRINDPELAWLRQKFDTNREIYNSFLEQITSSRITEAVESTKLSRGFQIVEPPSWPNRPVAPNKLNIFAAVMAAGISLGIGLVFFIDYLDHSLKDVDDIERVLGLRIVGTIPKITPGGSVEARTGFRRRAFVMTIVGASILVIVVLYTLRRSV